MRSRNGYAPASIGISTAATSTSATAPPAIALRDIALSDQACSRMVSLLLNIEFLNIAPEQTAGRMLEARSSTVRPSRMEMAQHFISDPRVGIVADPLVAGEHVIGRGAVRCLRRMLPVDVGRGPRESRRGDQS